MDVLVVDIWSDLAHFRKGYTTTSPLTYEIPPKTVIAGIIAAILGLPYDSYYEELLNKQLLVGIRLIKNKQRVEKIRFGINIINTKEGISPDEISAKGKESARSQILYEFIKQPLYRLFISINDQLLYEKLKMLLKEHKSFYTPYLGTANMIANFKFVSEEKNVKKKEVKNSPLEINSVVLKEQLLIEQSKTYKLIKCATKFSEDRKPLEFKELVFEENFQPVKIRSGTYYETASDRFVLF